MPNYIFANETRADIAAAVSPGLLKGAASHIAPRLFPIVATHQRAGSFYLAKYVNPSAVSDRQYGAELNGTHKYNTPVNYSTTKQEARTGLEDSDIEDLGGADPAILSSAEEGVRTILLKLDALAYATAKTAAGTAAALDPAAPFKAIGDAATKVKRYGEPYLVCGESWLNAYVANTTVATTLRGLYGDRILLDITTGVESVLSAVGVAFGVKGILVADDEAFGTTAENTYTTDATNAFVIGLRDMGANPLVTAKQRPVFGLMPLFIPSDGTEISVDTSFDAKTKVNYVDATAWAQPITVNTAAAKAVAIPASGWVSPAGNNG